MLTFLLLGGMIATTWVQIVKACLLIGGATVMAFLVLLEFGMNPINLFQDGVEPVRRQRARSPGASSPTTGTRSRSAWRSCSGRPGCRTS